MRFKNYIFENRPSAELTDVEMELMIDFLQKRSYEMEPNDPLPARDTRMTYLRQLRPFEVWQDYFIWLGDRSRLIGWGYVVASKEGSPQYEANKHLCWGNVQVDEDYRGQGIGAFLMAQLFKQTLEWEKEHLDIYCIEESGHQFFKKANVGIEALSGFESRVYFDTLDWNLVNEWNRIGEKLIGEVEIKTFTDVPEDGLIKFCEAYTKMENLVPKGESDWENVITPEYRRDFERRMMENGTLWITKITREKEGNISGLTEIEYNPKNPFWASQELTAVIPEYRGRGLGKWLKANMLIHLRDNYPEIKFVQTGNADVNAPMLSINNRLGFKEHRKYVSYLIRREDMENYQ